MMCIKDLGLQLLALQVLLPAVWGSTASTKIREGKGHHYCAGSCSPIADLDGDQIADLVLGCPWSLDEKGQVWVVSSATGKEIGSIRGMSSQRYFGAAVCGIEDVNGDARPELAVCGEQAENRKLQTSLYSGADMSVMWSVELDSEYGGVLTQAGDWNLDGSPDLLVGLPFSGKSKRSSEGSVSVLSGKDGSVLARQEGSQPLTCLGTAIARVRDLNGDGRRDYAVSAVSGSAADAIYILSGEDLSVLRVHASDRKSHMFGAALMLVNDLNGDGAADLAVGVSDGGSDLIGYVYVMCMTSGKVLRIIEGPQEAAFGSNLVYLPAEHGRPDRLLIGAYDYAVFSGAVYCHDLSTNKTTLLHHPLDTERKLGNEIRLIPREGTDSSRSSRYAVISCDERDMKGSRYLSVAKLYRVDDDQLQATFHMRDECKLILPTSPTPAEPK